MQAKTLEAYKLNLTLHSLERKVDEQHKEILRLQKNQTISESVARLPIASVEQLTTDLQIREVKASALHDALIDLRNADKGRSDLIAKIEDLE